MIFIIHKKPNTNLSENAWLSILVRFYVEYFKNTYNHDNVLIQRLIIIKNIHQTQFKSEFIEPNLLS